MPVGCQHLNESDQNYWAESYPSILEFETIEGLKSESIMLGFTNKKGASLSNSLVYEIGFGYENFDLSGSSIFVLCDLSYEDVTLTARKSSYGNTKYGITMPQLGSVTMKKSN